MRIVLQIFVILIAAGAITFIAVKLIEFVASRRSRSRAKANDQSDFDPPAIPFWVLLLVLASTALGIYFAISLLPF